MSRRAMKGPDIQSAAAEAAAMLFNDGHITADDEWPLTEVITEMIWRFVRSREVSADLRAALDADELRGYPEAR